MRFDTLSKKLPDNVGHRLSDVYIRCPVLRRQARGHARQTTQPDGHTSFTALASRVRFRAHCAFRYPGKLLVPAAIALLSIAVIVAMTMAIVSRASRPLRLAYQNRIASAVVILAVEQGFFAQEGLAVEAYRFNSGPACSEALFSGSADIGTMGDTAAVIALSRGAPLTIVASHGGGEHRHRIVVRSDSDIRQVRDLAGSRVGVKRGTSTYGGFLAFLAHNQLSPGDLRFVDLRPDNMPEALIAGSVDAFVASEPTPSLAEINGARELATLGCLGNNYPILILATDQLLAHEPQKVMRFMRALRRAERFLNDQLETSADIIAKVTGLSSEVAYRAMRRHTYTLGLDESILHSLNQTARFLKAQGIILEAPELTAKICAKYSVQTPDMSQEE